MRTKQLIVTALFVLLTAFPVLAQKGSVTVKGSVVDQNGAAIPLASVLVKGTTQGVSADLDGNYVITVPSSETVLEFSSVGYTAVEERVGRRSQINVILSVDQESLDEVMVIAYGTAKKGTYTGSAAAVTNDKFDLRPVTAVTSALAGTTAGVQVSTSNGMPGSDPTIRIRGIGSFNASNSPLIILDGMPYDNAMSSINPNDIESLTILKDASSAALYGARAANGVILINTKKGRSDRISVTASYNLGFTNRQTKDYKTLGTSDYMQMYWEAARNAFMYSGDSKETANSKAGASLLTGMGYNAYNTTADKLFDSSTGAILPGNSVVWADDLNWEDYLERTGVRHDANVSISGGTKKSDYYTSVGYTDDQGYWVGSELKRYSVKANVNSQITKWLKVGTNVATTLTDTEGTQSESNGNNTNPFRFIRYIGNIYPVHVHYANGDYYLDENGDKVWDFGVGYDLPDGTTAPKRDYMTSYNHAAEATKRYSGYRRSTVNAKLFGEVTFLKDFKFSVNGGLGLNMYNSHSADVVWEEKQNEGTSTKNTSNTTTWTFNEILSYSKDFGRNHIDAMAGHESYDYSYFYETVSKKGQIVIGDNYEFANYTEVNTVPNSYTSTYRVEGYLSRINYDYDGKYFASASFRRDGSSRFYKDVRWGNFWSVGAGWRIDKERFMSSAAAVDLLKLRASFGLVGNDDLDAYYPWMAQYTKRNNGLTAGYFQTTLGSTTLTWEDSANLDLALEWGLWRGRFNGTVEFFNRQSSNLLFTVPLPRSAGIDDLDMNAGSMYNRGFELTMDFTPVRTRDFSWTVNGNVTYLKNKITELPIDPYTSSPYKIEAGHPRYEFWLRQWKGVNPDDGYCLYEADLDNEAFVFEDDELITYKGVQCTENIEHAKYGWSGQAMPPFIGGFGMTFRYKGFTLGFDSYFQLGGKYYDSTYKALMSGYTGSSAAPGYHKLHVDVLKRWQNPGDVTDTPKFTGTTDYNNTDAGSSTRWLTTSNMFELTNVNLGYDIPSKVCARLGVQSIKLYCSGDNMLLISARRGMFPRRTTYSGYDGNSDIYLPARTISLGTKINF